MGCYSFVNHVLAHHPEVPLGLEIPTLRGAARGAVGCRDRRRRRLRRDGDDATGIPAAVAAARAAEVAVVVVGDRAGLFGRGTVGEGNDVEDLELPGLQRRLVEEVVGTGVPTVMVVLSGRPYAIGWAIDGPAAPAAVLQAFFPGEEGGAAIAEILSGRTAPSGRLPVSLPRSAGAQPYTYLHPILGGPSEITSADSTPALPFGHGLTYTTFEHTRLTAPAESATSAAFTVTRRRRQHRRARRSRRRAALRAGRVRERHPSGRAAGGLRAGRPRGRRASRRPLRGAVGASRVHRSPRGPHRRAG